MKKKIQKIITLSSIFLLVFLNVNISTGEQQGWIIDGDMIFLDDDNVYLSATPHTINGRGWVVFEFKNKVGDMSIDAVFGFSEDVKVSRPQIWRSFEHDVNGWRWMELENNVTFYNVTDYTVLDIADYDLYNNVIGKKENNTCLINITHNGGTATDIIAYLSQVNDGIDVSFHLLYDSLCSYVYQDYFNGWDTLNLASSIVYNGFGGMNRWHVFKDITTQKDRLYKIRVFIEPPFKGLDPSIGKYWWAIKPHSESLQKAINNGHLYFLDPWYNTEWGYRKKGYIQASYITVPQNNFPVMINITDTDLSSNALADGSDIIFINGTDDTTQFNHEIEKYDHSIGLLVAWINFTYVDATVNTSFYMYYGNPGASNQTNTPDVWDTDFLGVYHLNDSTTLINGVFDSTSYGNAGTYIGSLPTPILGITQQAQYFDGNGDYITLPIGTHIPTQGTVEIITWAIDDNTRMRMIDLGDAGDYRQQLIFTFDVTRHEVELKWTVANAWAFIDGSDPVEKVHHFNAISWESGSQAYVRDNSVIATETKTTTSYTFGRSYIGTYGVGGYFEGSMDELRISKIKRSNDWLDTTQNNILNASIFTIWAGEEAYIAPVVTNDIVFSFENPSNNSVDQPLTLTWNVTITDMDGDLMNWTIQCSNFDETLGTNETNGSKFLIIGGLIYSQLYIVFVNASDGNNWTNSTYFFTTIRFTGEGREIIIYATDFRKGSDSPTDETLPFGANGNLEVFVMSFDPTIGGNDEELFFKMHMPWDLDNEFNVEIHLIWFTDDWDGGVYNWDIEYLIKNESIEYGGDYNTSTGTPFVISENATPLANNQFIETLFSAGIDANVDQMIYLRLSLDKSMSNATKDAHLAFLEVKYFNVSSDTSDIMEIETTQFTLMINLVLFFFFFYIGYVKTKKRSGGAFMILSGFMLFAIEASLLTYISAVLVLPLISPFAIFILFLGGRKWLYPTDGDKAESEGS